MTFALSTWLSALPPADMPTGARPLTTVERVQQWLNPDQGKLVPQDTSLLERLVLGLSQTVLNNLNRDCLARVTRTEMYPTVRTGRLVLRNWPVLTVGEVLVGTSPAQAITLEPQSQGAQRIYGEFSGAPSQQLTVTYDTGFVRHEHVTIPSTAPYEVETNSLLLADEGVSDASGSPVAHTVEDGKYVFDAALAGQSVILVYSYVPEEIEQAVINEIGVVYRSRQRIGEASKALPNAGGTSSYNPLRLSELTLQMINNYRRVVPS